MTIKIIKTSGIPGTAASPGEGGGGSQPVQWEEIQGKPDTFRPTIGTTAITAKAGNYVPVYNEIKDRPKIPAAQVQSDWNEADQGKLSFIKNKPNISEEFSEIKKALDRKCDHEGGVISGDVQIKGTLSVNEIENYQESSLLDKKNKARISLKEKTINISREGKEHDLFDVSRMAEEALPKNFFDNVLGIDYAGTHNLDMDFNKTFDYKIFTVNIRADSFTMYATSPFVFFKLNTERNPKSDQLEYSTYIKEYMWYTQIIMVNTSMPSELPRSVNIFCSIYDNTITFSTHKGVQYTAIGKPNPPKQVK